MGDGGFMGNIYVTYGINKFPKKWVANNMLLMQRPRINPRLLMSSPLNRAKC